MNTFLVRLSAVTLCILLFGSQLIAFARAISTDEVLTNEKVITLVKAGLSTTIIVSKIRSSKTNFNTSTDELIRLKQAHIPDEIVAAMFDASNTLPKSVSASSSSTAVSSNKGVFVQTSEGWKRIEEVSSIEVRAVGGISSQLTLGLKESRVICVFRGDHSELQIWRGRNYGL